MMKNKRMLSVCSALEKYFVYDKSNCAEKKSLYDEFEQVQSVN